MRILLAFVKASDFRSVISTNGYDLTKFTLKGKLPMKLSDFNSSKVVDEMLQSGRNPYQCVAESFFNKVHVKYLLVSLALPSVWFVEIGW